MNDIIIIGGGISGMSLAHFCAAKGYQTLVIEKAPHLGGCIHSWYPFSDYWVELGTHTCYNSYVSLLHIIEQLGLRNEITARRKVSFRLLIENQIHPILNKLSIKDIMLRLWRLLYQRKTNKTVREFYEPIVGIQNYKNVFASLFAAVISQPAEQIPAVMIFKKRHQRNSKIPRSFTMQGGLSTIIDAIANHPKISTHLNTTALNITRNGNEMIVHTKNGENISSRFVALAVSPPIGASIIKKLSPTVASLLKQISITEIATTGIVVRSQTTTLPLVAGLIPINGDFYSIVTRDTVSDSRYRGFALHADAMVSNQQQLSTLADIIGIDTCEFLETTNYQATLPSPRIGHQKIIADIDHALKKLPLLITGNYFEGFALEDCVLRSKQESNKLTVVK
ncbi:MAG: FAD-dependent oxidoreductase [Deltaproteobacteria bacterium]|nr:FAD-dependent oxidoreductase [Deltaproteobacteria bacterium]